MKCAVKDLNQCTKVLAIDVNSYVVKESFDQFYKELSKRAKVPGFRPGKAPRSILSMHYRNEARDEVLKRLVSHSYHEAIQKNNIKPIGYPYFEDIDFGEDKLSYKAKIEVKPTFKLKKYKNIVAKREKIEVKKEEVAEVVNRIMDGYAKYVPVEDKGLEIGHFAVCDIISKIEGEKQEDKKNEWVEIRENDLIKGFASQTVGMKPGDEKEITVKIADNFPNQKIQGKQAVFHVTIKEIKEKQVPAVTADLLKEIGDYTSLDELEQAIYKDLEERKKTDAEVRLERDIIDKIEKDVTFDLPESIVKKRLQRMVQDAGDNMLKQGFSKEDVSVKQEEFKNKFIDEARRQVKVALVLDRIAERENIETNETDVEDRLEKISKQTRQPIDHIREYYTKNNLIDSLYAELRNQKVINFVKEHAEIK